MPKISALPAAVTLNIADLLVTVNGGVTKKITDQQLATLYNDYINIPISQVTGLQAILNAIYPVNTNITSMTGLTGVLQAPTAINSSAGLALLSFSYTPTSVNAWTITNAASGGAPALTASGTDGTVPALFLSKGGLFNFADNLTTTGSSIRVFNAARSQLTGFKKADAAASSVTFTVPDADGTADAPLITNGSGTLSFLAGAWTSFSGTIGYTGFSGTPTTNFALYKKIGRTVFINISMSGTSNATSFTITGLPFTCANANTFVGFQFCLDASANNICSASISGTTATLYFGTASNATGWTNSGTKNFAGSFFYETTT